ncbi:PilW family protein [Collimonas silvisoli]|uniref:PilW family protein n=1 Tax=Collimonas silvisoli TaxID=2825884 RepID=UPI001B8C8F72|nr:PilW family protein [Collimonas silvisoli]
MSICNKRVLKTSLRHGFSMVELLVAMTLAAGVLLLITTLYLSSKASFGLSEEKRRLQQDGSYAMALMERDLRQAGFGNLASTGPSASAAPITDFILADGTPAQGLRGCQHGFAKPLGSGKDFSCSAGPGMAGIEISYRLDDYADPASGAGADCNGASVERSAVPPDHPAYLLAPYVSIARNLFFVAMRTGSSTNVLYCHGNGNKSAQPIVNNVEDMQLMYGVAAIGDATPSQFLNATQVASLSGDQHQNWERVISVRLCLQLRGDDNLTVEPQRYVDCSGAARFASDRRLRAVFQRVVTLRNRAAASLAPPL